MPHVVLITSGKGGAGKSTVSVELSTALAAQGTKVVILEFDIGLRCIDIMLGVEHEVVYDLGDVIENRCTVSDAIISSGRRGQFDYIAAPSSISTHFDFDQVLHCIRTLRRMDYDYIIIDAPAGLGVSIMAVKKLTDLALIVTTPDFICVRDGAKVASLMEEVEFRNYRLIINRVSKAAMKKSGLRDLDEIIDRVGAQLLGVIPDDEKYRWASARGLRVTNRNLVVQTCEAIANRIEGKYVPLIMEKL